MDPVAKSDDVRLSYTNDRLLDETKAKAMDRLSCQLCFQTFRDARMLPCSHAFCLRCLQRLCKALQASNPTTKIGSFACPMCRKLIGLPRGGVGEFPPDTRVNMVVEEAVDEIMRKISRNRSEKNLKAKASSFDLDSSGKMDREEPVSPTSEEEEKCFTEHRKSNPDEDIAMSGRFSSRFSRYRPENPNLRETKARLNRSSSFNTTDSSDRLRDAIDSTKGELRDIRDLITPKIGRNRPGYASFRERRRRTIYAEDRPTASDFGASDVRDDVDSFIRRRPDETLYSRLGTDRESYNPYEDKENIKESKLFNEAGDNRNNQTVEADELKNIKSSNKYKLEDTNLLFTVKGNASEQDSINTNRLSNEISSTEGCVSRLNGHGSFSASGSAVKSSSDEDDQDVWRILDDDVNHEPPVANTDVSELGIDAVSKQKPSRIAFRKLRSRKRSLSLTSSTSGKRDISLCSALHHQDSNEGETFYKEEIIINLQIPKDEIHESEMSERKGGIQTGDSNSDAISFLQQESVSIDKNDSRNIAPSQHSIVINDQDTDLGSSVGRTMNLIKSEDNSEVSTYREDGLDMVDQELLTFSDEMLTDCEYSDECNLSETKLNDEINTDYFRHSTVNQSGLDVNPSARISLDTITSFHNGDYTNSYEFNAGKADSTFNNVGIGEFHGIEPTDNVSNLQESHIDNSSESDPSSCKPGSLNSNQSFHSLKRSAKRSCRSDLTSGRETGEMPNEGTAVLQQISSEEYVMPTAVVMLSQTCTVVADYGLGSLEYSHRDGSSPRHVINTLKPFSLTVDPSNDHVIVGDRKNKTVCIFDEFGGDIAQWDSDIFGWICGIGVLRNGNLVVLDRARSKIGVYTANGNTICEFGSYGSSDGQLCMGEFLTVDSMDRILTCDSGNHCIKAFSPEGRLIGKFGVGRGSTDSAELQWPKGICVDSRDNIIVADTCNNRVSMLSRCGQFVQDLVTNLRSPYALFYKQPDVIAVTVYAMNGPTQLRMYTLPA